MPRCAFVVFWIFFIGIMLPSRYSKTVIKKLYTSYARYLIKDKKGYDVVTLRCFPGSDLIREIQKIGLHNTEDIKCEWDGVKQGENLPNLEKWVREM